MQESKALVVGEALPLDWSETFCSSSSQSSITELPSSSATFAPPSAPPVVDLSHGKEESEDEILVQTIT